MQNTPNSQRTRGLNCYRNTKQQNPSFRCTTKIVFAFNDNLVKKIN